MWTIRDKHNSAAREQRALRAIRHLRRADARFVSLIEEIGPHRPTITADPFIALVGSIVQQQVSMTAAAAIYHRLRTLCRHNRLTPRAVLDLESSAMRAAGLSRQKVEYVRNVAAAFASRRLTRHKLHAMRDEDVVAATTEIKGVGRWTAEMLLIFCLERPDVWPIDDLGLRKGVAQLLGEAESPARDELAALAEPWRPYRTYATWYLWRSLEGPVMPGVAVRRAKARDGENKRSRLGS